MLLIICSSGGIGRRVGLKIQSGSTLGASSSLAWSNYLKTHLGGSFLVCICGLIDYKYLNIFVPFSIAFWVLSFGTILF